MRSSTPCGSSPRYFRPSTATRVNVGCFPSSLKSKPVTLAELQALAEKMQAVLSMLVYGLANWVGRSIFTSK